jgi:DNA-binding NarL/FixJ family response regulator
VRLSWPAGLSEREVDVLRLVARGMSNREVAGQLFISRRTAEHHVQNIYAKIGSSTRAAAAMFAMEHGLLRSIGEG